MEVIKSERISCSFVHFETNEPDRLSGDPARVLTDTVFHDVFFCSDEMGMSYLIRRPYIVTGYGSLNLSIDRIFFISCTTQIGVVAEQLFVH